MSRSQDFMKGFAVAMVAVWVVYVAKGAFTDAPPHEPIPEPALLLDENDFRAMNLCLESGGRAAIANREVHCSGFSPTTTSGPTGMTEIPNEREIE